MGVEFCSMKNDWKTFKSSRNVWFQDFSTILIRKNILNDSCHQYGIVVGLYRVFISFVR